VLIETAFCLIEVKLQPTTMALAMDMQDSISLHVVVSCIVSFEEFYVQKVTDKDTLVQIQRILNRNPKSLTGTKTVVNEEFVVAQFPLDKMMYRAKILSKFVELEDDLTEIEMVEIFFIDFGNTIKVSASSIRALPPTLQAIPGLAIRCTLFDCLALGEETSVEFSNLVTGHTLVMEVMGAHEKVLEVDLVREMEDEVGHTSVRDVLVLSGKAVFYSRPDLMIPNVEERKYKQVKSLTKNTVYTVLLSHTHKLCENRMPQVSVQIISGKDQRALELPYLMEQMKAVYSVKRSEELWGLGRCWPGMICAVRDSRDKMWYRGEVVNTIKGRLVLVKYVDFGNSEPVPAHRMRRLFTDFLDLPALATRVCLPVRVEDESILGVFKEGVGLADLQMNIIEEGSDKILPTVDLKLEGDSVIECLKQMQTL